MDFGKVITRAWEIIWKHKVLWIFGLLASCGTGGGGSSGGSGGEGSGYDFGGGELPEISPEFDQYFKNLEGYFEANLDQIITIGFALIAIGILAGILFFVVGQIGRVGLIQGTLKAESGVDSMTFGEIFEGSKPFFLRVIGLNLFIMLFGFIAVAGFMLVFFAVGIATLGVAALCFLPLMCLAVPVLWFLGIVIKQANIALVVEDLGITEALGRGWNIARENLANMVVMGLILTIGTWILNIIISIPQILMSIPVFVGLINGELLNDPSGFIQDLGGVLVLQLVYLPIYLWLRSVIQSYIESAWTLTFLEVQDGAGSEIEETPQLGEPSAA